MTTTAGEFPTSQEQKLFKWHLASWKKTRKPTQANNNHHQRLRMWWLNAAIVPPNHLVEGPKLPPNHLAEGPKIWSKVQNYLPIIWSKVQNHLPIIWPKVQRFGRRSKDTSQPFWLKVETYLFIMHCWVGCANNNNITVHFPPTFHCTWCGLAYGELNTPSSPLQVEHTNSWALSDNQGN